MDCRLENMTSEEIFCAEAGITSQEEYDAYIASLQADEEYTKAMTEEYIPTDEELEEMYQDYLASEAMAVRGPAIDYGAYDCAGWDIYD